MRPAHADAGGVRGNLLERISRFLRMLIHAFARSLLFTLKGVPLAKDVAVLEAGSRRNWARTWH